MLNSGEFFFLSVVLSEKKKFLNEKNPHSTPCKLNGRSLSIRNTSFKFIFVKRIDTDISKIHVVAFELSFSLFFCKTDVN